MGPGSTICELLSFRKGSGWGSAGSTSTVSHGDHSGGCSHLVVPWALWSKTNLAVDAGYWHSVPGSSLLHMAPSSVDRLGIFSGLLHSILRRWKWELQCLLRLRSQVTQNHLLLIIFAKALCRFAVTLQRSGYTGSLLQLQTENRFLLNHILPLKISPCPKSSVFSFCIVSYHCYHKLPQT